MLDLGESFRQTATGGITNAQNIGVNGVNNRKNKIRLLLADDHPVVRQGIRSCLTASPHVQVVAEAVDGREAVAKVREFLPDVVLMDVEMPGMGGLEATRLIRKDFPDVRVLILSMEMRKQEVLEIINSGAHGYVLKGVSLEELVRAIEAVHSGRAFFSPDISEIVLNQYVAEARAGESTAASKLTDRELQVLALIAEGKSNKEMASALDLGVRTVETHRERVMEKLNIHTVAGLTKYAISHGIAKID